MRTRQQWWAESAYNNVMKHSGEDDGWKKKYGAMAHKLPALVLSSGLAQAVAFLISREEAPHRALIEDLARTLRCDTKGLLEQSMHAPLHEYMRLTREVLGASQWYKRFAQSVLKVAPGEEP